MLKYYLQILRALKLGHLGLNILRLSQYFSRKSLKLHERSFLKNGPNKIRKITPGRYPVQKICPPKNRHHYFCGAVQNSVSLETGKATAGKLKLILLPFILKLKFERIWRYNGTR